MAATTVKFHVLFSSIMAHVVMTAFKGQPKHWNSVPASSIYSSSTAQLNGFRSSVELLSALSILWRLLLVFTKLFRDNTCRILIVWGANVLLVSVVPKRRNKYLKCDCLKPINLLTFFSAVTLHFFIGLRSKTLHCHLNWFM